MLGCLFWFVVWIAWIIVLVLLGWCVDDLVGGLLTVVVVACS